MAGFVWIRTNIAVEEDTFTLDMAEEVTSTLALPATIPWGRRRKHLINQQALNQPR